MAAAVISPLKGSQLFSLPKDQQIKFKKLVTKAKGLAAAGMIEEALEYNKQALSIYNSEKIAKRIQKMEEYLAQCQSSSGEEAADMVHVGDGFYLYSDLYNKLYRHQREGILWLWKIHKAKKGGILGDDMGLGKTIQVIAFLSGLFDAEICHAVLIVLPVAVIINWEKEFAKWAPGIRVVAFHGSSKIERTRVLSKVHRRGGVVLTSYGMLISNCQQLSERDGKEFVWDYVILDEGHKIKNPSTKGSKAVHSLPAKHRLILTGTPVQNNLKEMWALFDWTHQGALLGSARTFSMEYEQPIVRSRQKDATVGEQCLGYEIANSLKRIITPYFLRRTKAEVTKDKKSEQNNVIDGETDNSPEMPSFTRKNDLICWVYLSELQQKIYEAFVQSEEVRALLNSTRSPLTALVMLKKICDHPRLMSIRQCLSLGMKIDNFIRGEEDIDESTAKESAASRIKYLDNDVLVSESGKMTFLVELLDNLHSEGHRTLVFSQSRRMLDIIAKVMTGRGHKVARLDGTVRLLEEREQIINRFSNDMSYSLFLLTTQVGGVGLTLTAADRVVIFDPSWNPATDAQAVDRTFRIGQDKNVVIYRLITCGSIEEKIYRRQIFKDSITKQTTGESKNPYRYFSRQELHELFVLDNPRYSTTQAHLQEIHNHQRNSDTCLDEHIAFLYSLSMFGVSDHDLMFTQEAKNEEVLEEEGQGYISTRVIKAHDAIAHEAEENYQLTQQLGKYPAPEVNQIRVQRITGIDGGVPQIPHVRPILSGISNDNHLHSEPENVDSYEEEVDKSMHELTIKESPSREVGNQSDVVIINSDDEQESDNNISEPHPDFSSEDQGQENENLDQIAAKQYLSPMPTQIGPKLRQDLSLQEENKQASLEEISSNEKQSTRDLDASHNSGSVDSNNSFKSPEMSSESSSDKENKNKMVHAKTAEMPEIISPLLNAEERTNISLVKKTPKKRRSVCISRTPVRKFSEEELLECTNQLATDEANIITEELIISPKPCEPIMNMSQSKRDMSNLSTSEDEYDMFVNAIPMNSTVLPGSRKMGKRSAQTFIEDDGEEANRSTELLQMTVEESQMSTERLRDDNMPAEQRMDVNNMEIVMVEDTEQEEEENETKHMVNGKLTSLGHSCNEEKKEKMSEDEECNNEETEHNESGDDNLENHQTDDDSESKSKTNAGKPDDSHCEENSSETEEDEESEEEISEEEQQRYITLMSRSRDLYKQGDYIHALQHALDALEIYSGDERARYYALKLKKRVLQMETKLNTE